MVKLVSNALRQIRKLMNPGKEYAGKYAKVDSDGHLGFAEGGGGEGKIYTGREPIQVDNTNDIVGIATSYGLTTENGSLKVAVGDGISFNDQDRIYIKTGDGIAIDGNNNVKANIGDGIEFENGKIQANVGDGMMIRDHEITANLGNGLATDSNGHINVVPGSGITIDGSNRVQADIGAGLELVNSKIRARVGRGLDVDGNNYLTALLGDGLNFDGSARISAKPDTTKGLYVGSSGLGVNNGAGLSFNNNKLIVDTSVIQEKMSAPTTGGLVIANDKQIGINFKNNGGLTYDENGAVSVKLGDGINFDASGGVSAKPDTSKGLYVGSSGLGVNNGAGLTFANNKLAVDTTVIQEKLVFSRGLTEQSGAVGVNAGAGLTIDALGQLVRSPITVKEYEGKEINLITLNGGNIEFQAYGTATITATLAQVKNLLPSGYTPVTGTPMTAGSMATTWIMFGAGCVVTSSGISMILRNLSSEAKTLNVCTAHILCYKNVTK